MNDLYRIEDEEDVPTAPFWMTTFSDMVTLLLTFFVMIVAMSEVEVKKFEDALSYFTGRSAILMQDAVIPPSRKQPVTSLKSIEQSMRYESLLSYLEQNDLEEKVQVNLADRGLHVIITDSVMFESGKAELIEPSRTILHMIAGVLGSQTASVVVEGHTDDRPIHTPLYPSNWELSSARAASVTRFLLEQENALDPANYTIIGYGEHHPADTNETPEGRARNRRVEILFSWKPWTSGKNTHPSLTQPADFSKARRPPPGEPDASPSSSLP